MKFNKEEIIRVLIIIFGFFLVGFSLFNFWLNLMPIVNGFNSGEINSITDLNIDKGIFIDLIIFLIIGILVLEIGFNWKDMFKVLTRWFVSFGIFFLTISIFLFSLNAASNDLVNSIQPSIDNILAYSVDDVYNNYILDKSNVSIKVSLLEDMRIKKIYVNNLSLTDANFIIGIFGENNLNSNQKIIISKFIISQIYVELRNNEKFSLDSPIPISTLKNFVNGSGVDLSFIELIPTDTFSNYFKYNNNASINILVSNKSIVKYLNIDTLNQQDSNLVWNNLGLKSNISNSSKQKLIKLGLVLINEQVSQFDLGDNTIPVATLSSMIPNDFKKLVGYDVLNDNISIRADNIVKLRNSCFNNSINISQVCDVVMMTKYDNLMGNINNLTSNISNQIPVNLTSALSNYNSLDKVKLQIETKSLKWINYLFYFLLCIIFANIFYYLHFKLFNREIILVHIPYYVSKLNMYNFLVSFIFFIFIYYILISNILINFFANIIPNKFLEMLTFVLSLPIYLVILSIFKSIIIIGFSYLIFSIIIYLVLYFLLKLKLDIK